MHVWEYHNETPHFVQVIMLTKQLKSNYRLNKEKTEVFILIKHFIQKYEVSLHNLVSFSLILPSLLNCVFFCPS
jgi:hypothetical protein